MPREVVRGDASNYFKSVGTRSALGNQNALDDEGCDPSVLAHVLKDESKLIAKNWDQISKLYECWMYLLERSANIVVVGRQSKYKLIEIFKKKCLFTESTTNTITLHGFSPITLEKFELEMGITKGTRSTNEHYESYIEQAQQKKNQRWIFILHSFDSLYMKCRDVSLKILKLCMMDPSRFNLVMSVDHVNSVKILDFWQVELNLSTFWVPFGGSFFYEKTCSLGMLDEGSKEVKSRLFQKHFDQESLRDIYQALQGDSKKVLSYIIQDYINKCEKSENDEDIDECQTLAGTISGNDGKGRRKSKKTTAARKKCSTHLEFSLLLDHCQRNFIARRAQVLRLFLGEFKDHNLIEYDETGNKIQCLLTLNTCKEFIKNLETI